MFFKLGLLLGAGLTIGLITLALVTTSDNDSAGNGGQPEPATANLAEAELAIGPNNQKLGDDQADSETRVGGSSLEAFLIIWSQHRDQTLSVSLQVGPEDLTDCSFSLGDGTAAVSLEASAKVVVSGSQQYGCVGHFEDLDEINQPSQLAVEGTGGAEIVTCQFELEAIDPTETGRDLFWSTASPGCVGNFSG